MAAINFKDEYVEDILFGYKPHTIRRERKKPIKVGDKLQLYNRQRTKLAWKLADAVCVGVRKIHVSDDEVALYPCLLGSFWLSKEARQDLARNDGFQYWYELAEFLQQQYGLPFDGVLIEWTYMTKVADLPSWWNTQTLAEVADG